MKPYRLLLSTPALFCMLNTLSYADDKQFFLGARYGQYHFDLAEAAKVDDAQGFSAVGSLDMRNGFALEFEVGDSGKTHFTNTGNTIEGGDLRVRHLGAYAAYRTSTTVYGKLKLGVSVNSLDTSNLDCPYSLCTNTISNDGGSTAYGVGMGVRFSDRIRAELEYTAIDSDIDMIQLGVLVGL